MIQSVWFNLPVKDLSRSKQFYKEVGFFAGEQGNTEVSASFIIGKERTVLMLFEEKVFEQIVRARSANTIAGSEMMISMDVNSREEVTELAEKVRVAGGDIFSEPLEIKGGIYGFAFTDPDGHRWNVIHMGS